VRIAKVYNYPGPFDNQLISDMQNTYRREFLINGLKEKTDLEILLDFLKNLLPALFDILGVSVINLFVAKGKKIKHIINMDAFKEKKKKKNFLILPWDGGIKVNIKPNEDV